MDQEQKKYVLNNINKKSVEKIAAELNIKERNVRKFLEKKRSKKEDLLSRESKKSPPQEKKILISIILIIAVGALIYANSLGGEFVWDDVYLVRDNVYIRGWHNAPKIFAKDIAAGSIASASSYRPLQILSYTLDYSFWKDNVTGYHITSALIHIFAALCVFWLINLLFNDKILSLFTGLLFVAHPIHTEAVCYISGRADPLALVFILLSFIFYVKSINSKSILIYLLMAFSFLSALLSRESSLILPLLLLLYHSAFKVKIKAREYSTICAIAVFYILIRVIFVKTTLPHTLLDSTLSQRIPGFFVAITEYLRLLVLPLNLHMEYGYTLFKMTNPKALAGVVILLALLISAFKKRTASTLIFFSVSWFFLTLLPQSNLYPINAYMAEHWLYLPSIGFFLILAKGLSFLYQKKEFKAISTASFLAILIAFSYLTVRQNAHWSEPMAFYEWTLKHVPNSARAHNSLGIMHEQDGDYEAAVASYKKAIESEPNFVYAYHNLGKVHATMEKNEEAILWYKKTLEIVPDFIGTHFNLGNLYKRLGRTEEAIAAYNKALEIHPDYTEAYYSVGLIYNSIGREEDAIAVYKKAIEIDPGYAEAYNNLANIYNLQGKREEAIPLYEKAIKLKPGFADAYSNLGALYSYIGQNEKALEFFEKAIDVDPDYAMAHNNLAVLYLESKQYKLAMDHCDRAVSLGEPDPAILEALKPYSGEAGR